MVAGGGNQSSVSFTPSTPTGTTGNTGSSSTTETPSANTVVDISAISKQDPGSTPNADWQNQRRPLAMAKVIYKVLIQSLDYLKDLGISGIWLMPITKSEDRDHGYAVKDYRDIETDYGNPATSMNS